MLNLRRLIAVRHIKQADVAAALGVSPGCISNWLNGYTAPGINDLVRLCRFLDVSLDALTGIDTAADADDLVVLLSQLSPDARQLTKEFIELLLRSQQREPQK